MSKLQLLTLVLWVIPIYTFSQALDTASLYKTIGTADAYRKKNLLDSATIFYEQAINIFEPPISANKDSVFFAKMATCYEGLALTKIMQGKNTEGVALLTKTESIIQAAFVNYQIKIVSLYERLANYYYGQKKIQKLLEVDIKTLSLIEAFQMPILKKASKYMNIGTDYKDLGKPKEALDYLQIAESFYSKAEDTSGGFYLKLCLNYAAIYENLLEREKAIYHAQQGIDFLKTINFKSRAKEIDAAKLYQNASANHFRLKRYNEAQKYADTSLALKINLLKGAKAGDELRIINIGVTYELLGRIHISKKEFEQAENALKKAIEANIASKQSNIINYNELSYCHRLQGNFDKALMYSDSALLFWTKNNEKTPLSILPNDIADGRQLVEVYTQRSDVYKLKYDQTQNKDYLVKADVFIKEAFRVADYLNRKNNAQEAKESLREILLPIYERALRLMKEQYERENNTMVLGDFFTILEKSRAMSLLETLNANQIDFQNVPSAIIEQEKTLNFKITALEKQIYNEDLKALKKDTITYNKYRQDLFALKQEKEAWLSRLEKEYKTYYQLRHDPQLITLKELQAQLNPQQSMIEYFVGDTSIYILCANKYNVQLKTIKKDFPLERWIDTFRMSLKDSEGSFQIADKGFKLYQKLFAPILSFFPARTELNQPNKVFIVPDGVLAYLPFEALLTERPKDATRFASHKYLINDFIFSYNFSATLHSRIIQRKEQQNWDKNLVGFAPFYFENDKKSGKDIVSRSNFDNLDNTGEEVRYIAKNTEGVAYYGIEATKERFLETAKAARILHLATHGDANDRFLGYSFLAFSSPTGTDSLFVKDIYNQTIQAEMVVLSACETGLGKLRRGEGVISLSRSFIYAGAKSLIYSLWVANDESAKDLMKSFYDNLKKGMTKDEALWQAKIAYIDKAKNNPKGPQNYICNPFYWAEFVALGNMEALK